MLHTDFIVLIFLIIAVPKRVIALRSCLQGNNSNKPTFTLGAILRVLTTATLEVDANKQLARRWAFVIVKVWDC